MATTRLFQDMLNEYLANDLLKQELLRRDYILQKVEKDDSWKGGKIPVPFRGAQSSSIKFGALTASNDISSSSYIRGNITDYVEVWGSLIFNHRDLMDHSGRIPEDSFLKILPDEIEDFMDYMKMCTSVQLGTGPHFAVVTDDTNRATGVMVVDKIDRFILDQHILIDDDDTGTALDVYVTAIDVNTNSITLSATRGGAAVDLTAYTVAQNAKFYYDGVTDGAGTFTTFVSIRNALLSAANGGSATLHGVTKLAYPHLQAVNVDGSAITATNILDKIFDGYVDVRSKARGNANTVLLSYKHLGSIMKLLEHGNPADSGVGTQPWGGSYKMVKEPNVSLYGWTEIVINGIKGALTIVGIQEWDDDVIAYIDWGAMKFMSNGMFKKRMSPDGTEYFEVRNTTGYQYICDVSLFGEMMFTKPGNCGIIYGVSY